MPVPERAVGWAPSTLLVCALIFGLQRAAVAGESAEAIWPFSGVSEVHVSPGGEWIAATAHRGDDSAVLVQSIGQSRPTSLGLVKWIGHVAWESKDTLVYEAETVSGLAQTSFARFSLSDGKVEVDVRRAHSPGGLIDALPRDPDSVLWSFPSAKGSSIHRVSIDDLVHFNDVARRQGGFVELGDRLAAVSGRSSDWVVDADGFPRAALRHPEKDTVLVMPTRKGRSFASVLRWKDDEQERSIVPVGLTENGERLIVLAYAGNDTRGLYEFDETKRAPGKAVFVHPDLDVSGALLDRLTGDLVAAVYFDEGERRFEYLDTYRQRFIARLPEAWQRDSIAILSGTADRQAFAFLDAGATNPGDFHFRARDGLIHPVGRWAENVDRSKLAPVEAFRAKSADGTKVEAYLTRPRASARPTPLVVMPHGGPFGVRDVRLFDPIVQYLASWGFAVLQVNFRGSEGYGLEFKAKVRKAWARGIEDDIDAAVELAMKRTDIDAARLCIIGGSYGGFSALASVIRHRDRYRCAISINGVTDVPLLADSSDFADSKRALASWQQLVGDLDTEREKLIEVSPAYHTDAIDVPVQVIQGTADRRVDPDHAHRLVLMLELLGKDVELLEIEEGEHGFDRDEWVIVARAIRRFLTRHLTPESRFEPDPRFVLAR